MSIRPCTLSSQGRRTLVGTGPGDPELLTVKLPCNSPRHTFMPSWIFWVNQWAALPTA
ncbi:hypothetical protein GALL_534330 [mine drainage metagenome]|uniref:Uncharacterized protein n=1 Tax=mine drainage metagenome TaxID=410659 RepID=A0A1J5PBY8_9ZZZZ